MGTFIPDSRVVGLIDANGIRLYGCEAVQHKLKNSLKTHRCIFELMLDSLTTNCGITISEIGYFLSNMGHVCRILKRNSQLFTAHSFTNSRKRYRILVMAA